MGDVVQFTVDAAALQAALKNIPGEQLPFVTAVAFQALARRMVDQGQAAMQQHFTIRSTWVLDSWVARTPQDGNVLTRGGFYELKNAWPNTTVIVGHRDEYMRLQEVGGFKMPQHGEQYVAIPTRLAWSQRNPKGSLPKTLTHFRLLREDRARLTDEPTAGEAIRLNQKKGRRSVAVRRLEGARRELELMFLRRPFARIVPRAGLRDMAQHEFDAHVVDEFERAWARAMAMGPRA